MQQARPKPSGKRLRHGIQRRTRDIIFRKHPPAMRADRRQIANFDRSKRDHLKILRELRRFQPNWKALTAE
jgi:hypothetical protein